MPDTPAQAIPGVRLEYDHGVYIGGSFVLHHLLIAGRTIAGRSVGWPESVHRPCAMVTQRGDGRRRAAHTPADMFGSLPSVRLVQVHAELRDLRAGVIAA
jgi:hypothetical protein